MPQTDAQLALRVRNGEEWAFEELLARHDDLISAKVSKWGAIGEDYDDFHQAALLALYKAACLYTASRGTSFRTWANMVIHAALVDFLKAACLLRCKPLDESMRFEQPVRGAHEDTVPFGELIPGPASDDPCAILIASEEFARNVRVLMSECSEVERAVVARRLNGLSLIESSEGLGKTQKPGKVADNALGRVRRKLAAAA